MSKYIPKPGDLVRVRGRSEVFQVTGEYQPAILYRVKAVTPVKAGSPVVYEMDWNLTYVTPDDWERTEK